MRRGRIYHKEMVAGILTEMDEEAEEEIYEEW